METAVEPRGLPRRLGLVDATSIVVGTMIGSAIFIVPSAVAQGMPSTPWILGMWLAAGVLSMFGALAYAELGAMMPETGGQYVYLREAWGPLWGFLCGWTFFLAARSGGTASVAAGFAIYLGYFVPMPVWGARLVAAGLILLLTAVNVRGVRVGAGVQNVFTGLKVAGLAVIIAGAFAMGREPVWQEASTPFDLSLGSIGAALIPCLWAYNGWYAVSLVGGEIRNPQRNIPRAVLFGTGAVTLMYLLANAGYLRTLTVAEIAGAERVASASAVRSMGAVGSAIVAATILMSTFGTVNGNTLTAPRIYFAQARDGLFFRAFGKVHPVFETPYVAIIGQGIWCAVLALTGSYAQLIAYATITFWIFYAMTAAGLLMLRRTRPDAARPYRMWGYPVTPVLFIAVAMMVVVAGFVAAPATSAIGVGIVAAGVPAYYMWRRAAATDAGRVRRDGSS